MSELVAKPIAVAEMVGFADSSTHPTKPPCHDSKPGETLNCLLTAFDDELEIFRTEEAAQQYFIAYLSIQTLPPQQPGVILNQKTTLVGIPSMDSRLGS